MGLLKQFALTGRIMGASMTRQQAAVSYWQGVLSRIRGRVTEQQFDTWFKAVEPSACSDEVLELSVPNTFSREWLRKKYGDIILGAAAAANGGRRPALRITVREGEASGDGVAVPGADTARQAGQSAAIPQEVRDMETRSHPGSVNSASDKDAAGLNPNYTFTSFVSGAGNRLAGAAAMAVAEKDLRVYNPLFIHGGVGLGKSHLLQAICAAWRARRPQARVLYVSCEQFINQFIAAVEKGDLDGFRRRYRELDLLAVDDIQFLANKERTQEEFFHTFNWLHQRQSQVVLSADMEPRALAGLTDRLISRFRWGMVCELERLGYDTRLDIVRRRADMIGVAMPDDVCALVAESVRTNVRELEGAVTRVIGLAHLSGRPLDQALTREALKDTVVERRRRVTIDHIARAVTRHYDVKLAELQSKRRTQAIALPRQVCMYLARRLTGHSLEEVGGFFGGRDHSTVLYGVERIGVRMRDDEDLRETVEQLAQDAVSVAGS